MMPQRLLSSREDIMVELVAFSGFTGEKVISLETYRRNGEPVRTPVWFLEENGMLYVHTDDGTGKVKRIRRSPKVRVAPSHFRGKPKSEYIDAQAELETGAEFVEKYYSKIYKKYGLAATLTKFVQRFSRSKANDIIIVIRPS
jgi:PPOX class probable F420-dependent enzyme